MPVGTPMVKIENTRRHGAEIVISGKTLEEAAEFARAHGKAQNLTMIHPYDDPHVIAGQGSIALEMLAAVPQLDTLVVPIDDGGLISGMSITAKSLKPDLRIVSVRPQLYPVDVQRHQGRESPMRGDTLAEGIAVDAPAGSPPKSSAVSSMTLFSSRRSDQARNSDADHDRKDHGRGRRRGRPCRRTGRTERLPDEMSASF